jgi:hypothetical protein
LSYNVKGSEVSWSVTSPTPLAGGWIVKFVGSAGTPGSFAVDEVANAVTTTCGGTVLTEAGDFVSDESGTSLIKVTLGSVATVNNLVTYAPYCAGASEFKATVNNWKGSGAATAITAGNCVITLASSTLKAGAASDVA